MVDPGIYNYHFIISSPNRYIFSERAVYIQITQSQNTNRYKTCGCMLSWNLEALILVGFCAS